MVEIGLVGKPNVGKSTFFSALTMHIVEIANYPFTTIEANRGTAYVRKKCPHLEIGKKCNPKKSVCMDGTRLIPVEVIDVAGLVPDAHRGRGLGNKFLDDLRQASSLIHIVDSSGRTDAEGNIVPKKSRDPMEDVEFLEMEISYWIANIIGRNWQRIARKIHAEKLKIEEVISEKLSGLNIGEGEIREAIERSDVSDNPAEWSEDDILTISHHIRNISKPMLIAANKADIADYDYLMDFVNRCEKKGYKAIPTSAEYELALKKAAKAGLIEYRSGDKNFKILKGGELSERQKKALQIIEEYLEKFGSTGIQDVIEYSVFNLLNMIAVYPVEDENKWTDKDGNVLPDVYLLPKGTTARDLAYKVHTDLGENFIRAIDGRTKKILGKDYILKDGNVIKIVVKK